MAEMKQFGIDLELDDAVAQGHYSNLAIISHSTSEFIIDFATVLPGVQKARVKSRIILTPEHAKRLLRSLQENIVRYESNVGKIEIPSPQPTPDAGPKMAALHGSAFFCARRVVSRFCHGRKFCGVEKNVTFVAKVQIPPCPHPRRQTSGCSKASDSATRPISNASSGVTIPDW